MSYSEAKEHTPGRLHELFADPYRAFENDTDERQLHVRIMLHTLLARPMQRGQVTLRVIHGWENGGFEPADLQHADFTLRSLKDFDVAVERFAKAARQNAPLPADSTAILAAPLLMPLQMPRQRANPSRRTSLKHRHAGLPLRAGWRSIRCLRCTTAWFMAKTIPTAVHSAIRRTAHAKSTSSISKRANLPCSPRSSNSLKPLTYSFYMKASLAPLSNYSLAACRCLSILKPANTFSLREGEGATLAYSDIVLLIPLETFSGSNQRAVTVLVCVQNAIACLPLGPKSPNLDAREPVKLKYATAPGSAH